MKVPRARRHGEAEPITPKAVQLHDEDGPGLEGQVDPAGEDVFVGAPDEVDLGPEFFAEGLLLARA